MANLNHPCKQTCSGWQQGFEKGQDSLATEVKKLTAALERVRFLANKPYGGFQTRLFECGVVAGRALTTRPVGSDPAELNLAEACEQLYQASAETKPGPSNPQSAGPAVLPSPSDSKL